MIASRDKTNKNKLSKKALPHSLLIALNVCWGHWENGQCAEEEQAMALHPKMRS